VELLTTLLYQGYQRRRGKKYRGGDSADRQQQVGLTWSVAPKRPCAFCPQRQQNNPTDESLSCNHTLYVPLTCHEACIFIARFFTCQGARELSFLSDIDHKSCVLVMIFRYPAPRLRQHRDCCTGPYCWRDAGVKQASVVDLSCQGDRLCTTSYLHFVTIRLLILWYSA
jgi:hypothetical protein